MKQIIFNLVKFVAGPALIILIGMPLLGAKGFMHYLIGTVVLLFIWFTPWEIASHRQAEKDKVYRRIVLENSLSANSNYDDLEFVSDTGFQPDFIVNYSPLMPSERFHSDSYISGKYNGVYFEQAHVDDHGGQKDLSGTVYVIHVDIDEERKSALNLGNTLCKFNDDNVCVYISDSDANGSSNKVMEIIDGLKS